MNLAEELRATLIHNSPQPKNKEAYEVVLNLIREAHNRNEGGLHIILDNQWEDYSVKVGIKQFSYEYSKVLELLKREGFEVEIVDEEDDVEVIIWWSYDHPVNDKPPL